MSALPVTEKEGWRRGKNGIGPRMKYGHANHIVGELSKKKQILTTKTDRQWWLSGLEHVSNSSRHSLEDPGSNPP